MRSATSAPRTVSRLQAALISASAVAVLGLLAAGAIYQRFSTARPVVTIGTRTISKREYYALLEQRAGRQVLTGLVYGELVRQAAARAHLTPSTGEVEARVALLRSSNPGAADDAHLRQTATNDLALENLRIRGVTATDAEVGRFYSAHQTAFRRQGQGAVAVIAAESAADASSAAALLRRGVAPAIIAHQPGFHLMGQDGYSPEATAAEAHRVFGTLQAMKPGEVRLASLGGTHLAMILTANQPTRIPPLQEVRDQVARLVKLQKAPTAPVEIAALYREHPPRFATDGYAEYFADIARLGAGGAGPGRR